MELSMGNTEIRVGLQQSNFVKNNQLKRKEAIFLEQYIYGW